MLLFTSRLLSWIIARNSIDLSIAYLFKSFRRFLNVFAFSTRPTNCSARIILGEKKFFRRKEIGRHLVSANSRARKSLGISLSRQLTVRKSAPLQHSKVIRSPEGSVNCFSRREAADGEGSEDPDAPPTPLSDVQIVSLSALFFLRPLRTDFSRQ